MYVGYFYAVRGALKHQERLDVVANNLANADNLGFKQGRVSFGQYLIEEVKPDYSQGPLRETDRELDVALMGPGFFKVQTDNGAAYSRDGAFHLTQTGQLVNGEGYPILGQGGPITIPQGEGAIHIDARGAIYRGEAQVGALDVVDFEDKANLVPSGNNLFRYQGQGDPAEVQAVDTEVVQKSVELSNVNIVREMVDMIDAQRAFESHIKALQSFNEINQKAATEVGRLR